MKIRNTFVLPAVPERGQSTEILHHAQRDAAMERVSFSWHLSQYVIAIAKMRPLLFYAAEHVLGRASLKQCKLQV